jgi:hypothetical protein
MCHFDFLLASLFCIFLRRLCSYFIGLLSSSAYPFILSKFHMRILIFLQAHTFTSSSPTPHIRSLTVAPLLYIHFRTLLFTHPHSLPQIQFLTFTPSHILTHIHSLRLLLQIPVSNSLPFIHSFINFFRIFAVLTSFRENSRGVGVWHLCCCWLHCCCRPNCCCCWPHCCCLRVCCC